MFAMWPEKNPPILSGFVYSYMCAYCTYSGAQAWLFRPIFHSASHFFSAFRHLPAYLFLWKSAILKWWVYCYGELLLREETFFPGLVLDRSAVCSLLSKALIKALLNQEDFNLCYFHVIPSWPCCICYLIFLFSPSRGILLYKIS